MRKRVSAQLQPVSGRLKEKIQIIGGDRMVGPLGKVASPF